MTMKKLQTTVRVTLQFFSSGFLGCESELGDLHKPRGRSDAAEDQCGVSAAEAEAVAHDRLQAFLQVFPNDWQPLGAFIESEDIGRSGHEIVE